jgi:putative transposase
LDAQYEKVSYEGWVGSLAAFKAVGVDKEGYREVLDVSCNLSETEVHLRAFLESLMKRGMYGTYIVTSNDRLGLKAALKAILPSVPWQRCLFHLAQNAQAYAPSKVMKAELSQSDREIYQAKDRQEAEQRLENVVEKYKEKASRFCEWLVSNFCEGLTFYSYPKVH